MKIGKLFQFVGRKHLQGATTLAVSIPAGTRLVLKKASDGYELHAESQQRVQTIVDSGQQRLREIQGVSAND